MSYLQVVPILCLISCGVCRAGDGWIDFSGGAVPGEEKRIVLISGDEEYRSEEALPMLAQILSKHHGFTCRVVFSMSDDGYVDPNASTSLEGLEALNEADLMIIFTRFRRPSDEAMQHIDNYLATGKPVIGLRTATHAFNGLTGKYAHYNDGNSGGPWDGGFGRRVLGEKWINHHGSHGSQSTRGIIVEGEESHPILRGIKPGEIWGTTDVYGVRLPMQESCKPLVLGQVLEGMHPNDAPLAGEKNEPMMPVVWTKAYLSESGKGGTAICTTMGASQDFVEPGLRRLMVNSVYWLLGMDEAITDDLAINFVADYKPSSFGFRPESSFPNFWKDKNLQPAMYKLK